MWGAGKEGKETISEQFKSFLDNIFHNVLWVLNHGLFCTDLDGSREIEQYLH